jgi:hypothetical protein
MLPIEAMDRATEPFLANWPSGSSAPLLGTIYILTLINF